MTPPRPRRAAFAAHLDRLMREGVNARDAKGTGKAAVWSNAALAARHDKARADGGEATTSPNSVANWRKGKSLPANVEPLIAAIYGDPPGDLDACERLRALYRAASAEKLDLDAQAARQRTGNLFEIGDDQAQMVRKADASDLARARDPGAMKLKDAVRRDSEKLARLLAGVEDDGTARDVAEAARELAELAALAAEPMVARLYDLFIAVTRLGGFNKGDNLRRHEVGRNVPALPGGGAGALSALAALAYAWALGFPTVKELDAHGARGQETPATTEDARAVFTAAREQDAIGAVDAETLSNLTNAANPDTRPGQTAAALANLYVEDFTATAAQGIARAASGDEAAEPFARKALATLREAPQAQRFAGSELAQEALRIGAETFAATTPKTEAGERRHVFVSYAHQDNDERPPGDTRGWKDWALSYLKPLERHRPIKIWVDSDLRGGDEWEPRIRAQLAQCDIFVLLLSRHAMASPFILDVEIATVLARQARGENVRVYGIVLTSTPDALLDPVRQFLLRPHDARPLALLPEGERGRAMAEIADEITALAREWTQSVPADVEARARALILEGKTPPAAWRSRIRKLDFSATDLSDAAPLAGLTVLTSLDLSVTQIAVAAPLAGLKALASLNLGNTKIADAAPLAGLTALTWLNLAGTKIADAAPLAGLSALKSLELSDTAIANAAPLAGLTALVSLDLRDTPIADAAPLAGLTALTLLSLASTKIADAAPLAGLTALSSLYLWSTQIADAAPLAGLTALASLNLGDTQIADAAPLAGLTALTSLILANTQIADAAPLAGLTALTSLNLANTQIADAAPLARLTALASLNLRGTQIADAAPLAGLTALTSLDLRGTQIADAAPLARLENLQKLFLDDPPPFDLAPLAGLIANGLKIESEVRRKPALAPRPKRPPPKRATGRRRPSRGEA